MCPLCWGVLFAFASLDGSWVAHAAAVEMAHPQPGVSPPTERTRTTEVVISAYEGRALHMHNFCYALVLPQSIFNMNLSKLLKCAVSQNLVLHWYFMCVLLPKLYRQEQEFGFESVFTV